MATNLVPKSSTFFVCKNCDYITYRKSQYDRHVLTAKHLMATDGNKKVPISQHFFNCICGKKYKDRTGLWKHKKKCYNLYTNDTNDNDNDTNDHDTNDNNDTNNYTNDDNDANHNTNNYTNDVNNDNDNDYSFDQNEIQIDEEFKITPKMFYDLLKQNNELQKNLIELASKPIIGNNNNVNSNNKTFNLQVFLNETCKDALNINEFVNQITLSISDLEETGKLGYAEGISKVFIKNLKHTDITRRPIHCSDSKREILYIKNEDQWSKDDNQKTTIKNAIKQVANKNIKQISEWQKHNPKYSDPESKQNDKYMKIVLNSMSGSTKEEAEKNYEKIVKNISKEVVIQKDLL